MGNDKKKKLKGEPGAAKTEKPVHIDFKEHNFDLYIDTVEKGEEIKKIYECKCGARLLEVYVYLRDDLEGCKAFGS